MPKDNVFNLLERTGGGESKAAYIVDSSYSESSWYRVWSDGFIEQGGVNNFDATSSGAAVYIKITFPVSFTGNTYVIYGTFGSNDKKYNAIYAIGTVSKTSSSIGFQGSGLNSGQTVSRIEWRAEGY